VNRAGLLLLLLFACLTTSAQAHPAPFSYLDLRLGKSEVQATLTVHVADLAYDLKLTPPEVLFEPSVVEAKRHEILDLLRSRLMLTADGTLLELDVNRTSSLPERHALAFDLVFRTSTLPGLLKIECSMFPYDPQHQTLASIYEEGTLVQQEIFTSAHTTLDHFTGGRQGRYAVVKKFISGGIYHIFAGPDHILFLLGLLLLGGSMLRLLTIVTAFTIAHSITLTLATLNVINPPERLIESAIALSIIFIGIDNLVVGKAGRDVRVWVAFFFGLVHGFGFASVLREFGLPGQALAWSLFSFNLGVEIGQACIVVVMATALAMVRKYSQVFSQRIAVIGSVVVIIAGSYWFVQRAFF
jgi:hydrogenase/urease accessory protein HupE